MPDSLQSAPQKGKAAKAKQASQKKIEDNENQQMVSDNEIGPAEDQDSNLGDTKGGSA